MGSLDEVYSRSLVMGLSGPEVYVRGVSYFRQGRVVPEAGSDERLRAAVRGSMPYTVELWVEGGQPGWSCTCPYAEDGSLCKHAVAVSLLFDESALDALLDGPLETAPETGEDQRRLLVDHIGGLERERLSLRRLRLVPGGRWMGPGGG